MSKSNLIPDNWCKSRFESFETSFLWTVDNFSLGPENMKSSAFRADKDVGIIWRLYLYKNSRNDEEFIGLTLRLTESNRQSFRFNYKLAIIDGKQQIIKQREAKNVYFSTLSKGSRLTCPFFIIKSLLVDPNNQLLPNDRLTIYCEVTIFEEYVTSDDKIGLKRKHKTITDHINGLFDNPNDSDVEIVVKGHKFSAHKLILKTRSPVFAAMFEYPLKESQQNRVIIEDIDKEVFGRVLRFIYTDKVVNEDIDWELLSAADKYFLDELKSICEEYIGSELTAESVCDVLILADRHFAQELKAKAINYIKANVNKVMKTIGWKNVIDRSDLLELF